MKVKEFINILDSSPDTDITFISLSTNDIAQLYKLDDEWLSKGEQGDFFDIDMDFRAPGILLIRPILGHSIDFDGKRLYPKEESIKVVGKYIK